MPSRDRVWTIVLAAGEGSRLRSLTRALYGEDLPKQFAVLRGRRSMLQATLHRASAWSRSQDTVVVVAQDRERLARTQLESYANVDVAVQPVNLGTAPGILLPLARVLARDPAARVVVTPSDHHVENDEVFSGAVRTALRAVSRRDNIVLLGAVPDDAEEQYGWIVPCAGPELGCLRVSSFREKPEPAIARALQERGALWSTFVFAGSASRLWALLVDTVPDRAHAFERYRRAVGTSQERDVLAEIYRELPPADFSKHCLERADELEVVALPPCGWSDWGTPERIFESLAGTADYDALMGRLGRSHVRAEPPGSSAGRARRVA